MENIKIAVALRSARTALGWNQQEFADKMLVAKSTIARIETLEMTPKADFLTRALRLFHDAGVSVDLLHAEKIVLGVEFAGLREAKRRLENDNLRRSDRKVGVQVEQEPTVVVAQPRQRKTVLK